MVDVSPKTWEAMAEFNNALTELVDKTSLTLPETVIVLEMIVDRLRQLLEVKKVG